LKEETIMSILGTIKEAVGNASGSYILSLDWYDPEDKESKEFFHRLAWLLSLGRITPELAFNILRGEDSHFIPKDDKVARYYVCDGRCYDGDHYVVNDSITAEAMNKGTPELCYVTTHSVHPIKGQNTAVKKFPENLTLVTDMYQQIKAGASCFEEYQQKKQEQEASTKKKRPGSATKGSNRNKPSRHIPIPKPKPEEEDDGDDEEEEAATSESEATFRELLDKALRDADALNVISMYKQMSNDTIAAHLAGLNKEERDEDYKEMKAECEYVAQAFQDVLEACAAVLRRFAIPAYQLDGENSPCASDISDEEKANILGKKSGNNDASADSDQKDYIDREKQRIDGYMKRAKKIGADEEQIDMLTDLLALLAKKAVREYQRLLEAYKEKYRKKSNKSGSSSESQPEDGPNPKANTKPKKNPKDKPSANPGSGPGTKSNPSSDAGSDQPKSEQEDAILRAEFDEFCRWKAERNKK